MAEQETSKQESSKQETSKKETTSAAIGQTTLFRLVFQLNSLLPEKAAPSGRNFCKWHISEPADFPTVKHPPEQVRLNESAPEVLHTFFRTITSGEPFVTFIIYMFVLHVTSIL